MKRKILREENTMLDAQRNVSGVGAGSKDDPFVQLAIPINKGLDDQKPSINYPYQINRYKDQLFDVFEKLITLRKNFQECMENPSVTESQKIALNKSVKRIDTVNSKLLEIPDFLNLFSVDN